MSVKFNNFDTNQLNYTASLFNNSMRYFASRGHNKRKKMGFVPAQERKSKFVKPHDVGDFTPTVEPVLQLENGYYLLYYHRQRKYTMFLLYLKFLIPICALIYLIKKNPFYKSYPIALPMMFIVLFYVFFKTTRYSAKTNRMVHQILMDPSGTEVTFVYKNRFFRKMRNDNLEETLLVQSLVNPPQGNEYVPLKGQLFPEKYPFRFELLDDGQYFWLKYYVSQHNFFALAKKPDYVNYEILCNVFATKTINFSQAKMYKFNSTQMTRIESEFVLDTLNPYSKINLLNRMEKCIEIQRMINESKAKIEAPKA